MGVNTSSRLALLRAVLLLAAVGGLGFRPIAMSEVEAEDNVAIGGYDAVAYFTRGEPTRGRAILRVEWQGALWYFANRRHQRLFEANPDQYAPAYGGFCAFCIADSETAPTNGDPEVFLIHEDRLYLLQSEAVKREWMQDLEGHTARARAVYAGLVTIAERAGDAEQ